MLLFNKYSKKFLNYVATVVSCVVIIVLGITFFSRATTVTTTIGENISTNDLIVYGNATTTGSHYIGGNLSVAGSLTTPYFTATSTTATSTFPYLTATQSNVGTVVGGTWNGSTIGVAYGGTGLSSYTANRLLYASGSGTISQIATSSLGLLTTDVAEGSNLYWTNTRFDNRLSATTTLPNITTLLGLTNATTSLLTVSNGAWFSSGNVGIGTSSPYAKLSVSGIGVFDDYVRASYFTATSTTATSTFPYLTATQSNVGTVVGGTWNGSTIGVAYGGTGLSSYTINQLLYASGAGTIAQIATSSLGLLTTDVVEGTNLYWTATRFDNRLSATTTLPNLTTLLGLTNATTSLLTVSNGAWFTSGNVGIGTSSPYAKLSVSGIGVFDDYVRASYFTATSTTATTTFAGGLNVGSGGLVYDFSSGNVGIGTAGPSVALELGADKSLRIIGGTSFPSSPTEGQMFFRTDNKQLYVYANAKWQADRTTATKIVAASDSQNQEKADYVCDGTNDEVEINQAIDALPSTGGMVFLLDGTYTVNPQTLVSGTIYYAIQLDVSNTSLIGSGANTVIKLKNSWTASASNVGYIVYASSVNSLLLENLKIDGNRSNNTTGEHRGIMFNAVTYSKINNLWIENVKYHDIYFSAGSDYNIISNNRMKNNSIDSFIISSSYNNIIGNTFEGNVFDVLVLSSGSYNTVVGNTIYNNTGKGIYVYMSSYNTITGNKVDKSSAVGIEVSYGDHNTITANSLHNNGGSGSLSSIRLTTSDSNIISSNRITDTAGTGYAISIAGSDCDNNVLIGNYYSGTGATSINDAGTNTIYNAQLVGNNLILKSSGNIGIGTTSPYATLSVTGTAVITATTTIGISSTGQQAGLQIGYGGICVDNDGSCVASTTGRVSAVELVTAASDLAEIYYSSDNLEAGDIVITKGNNLVGKADKDKQNSIIGVVSAKPGFILGLNGDNPGTSIPFDAVEYPIALAGRVPVKVSLEGGDISVGDPLTISLEYGVAKKATEAGKIIGYALEEFMSQAQDNATTTPKILTFLNLTYWFPTADITGIADVADNSGGSNIISQSFDWILDQFKNIGLTIANGVIQAKEFIADKIKTKELEMEDSATGEAYCVKISNGEWMKEKGVCGETNVVAPPTDNSDAPPAGNNVNENLPIQEGENVLGDTEN